ncbi:Diphthamide biosynthesis protein 2 [Irineochytrium annulatum]|nr:Diphthamide biosynthesis protein 2 [Irineochytrium annulatum]
MLDFDFEHHRVLATIAAGSFFKVALQFPDELLHVSAAVAGTLTGRCNADPSLAGRQFFILADTTYGSCCADEVAAEHVQADFIVLYGRSCLSRSRKLPVLHVFGKAHFDVSACVESLAGCLQIKPGESAVALVLDTMYYHLAEDVRRGLTERGVDVLLNVIEMDVERLQTGLANGGDGDGSGHLASSVRRHFEKSDKHDVSTVPILYVGQDSMALSNLLLTNGKNEFYRYDPDTRSVTDEKKSMNRIMMRRYALMQKARDADVIGIVVGTLGVGMKPYLIAVGKPNPAKLGNFLEIDAFVLVACPENSLLDSRDFLRPIVTPFELELALSPDTRDWGGDYITDLALLAPRLKEDCEAEMVRRGPGGGEDEEDDGVHFSLASGRMKTETRYATLMDAGDAVDAAADAIGGLAIERRHDGSVSKFVVSSAAADYLNNRRTFKGLEATAPREVELATEGRSGVASGYSAEREEE